MALKAPEKPMTVQSKPIMERHLQSILLAVIIGLIGWAGMTITFLNSNSVRQEERVNHLVALTEQLRQDLRALDTQYMTRRESEAHRNDMRSKVEVLEARVIRLENSQ